MEPASIAIPAAVNGMKVLISAYEGYEQTRVRRTDRAVREDVRRRIHQVHRQVERWMIRTYTNGEKYEMNRIQYILHNLSKIFMFKNLSSEKSTIITVKSASLCF